MYIWVVTRKAHHKLRQKVIKFGKITKTKHGYIASPKDPIDIALIEWGTLIDYQRKMASPAYQGMLYDIATKTKSKGWVGTGASMGFPLDVTLHRFEFLTS